MFDALVSSGNQEEIGFGHSAPSVGCKDRATLLVVLRGGAALSFGQNGFTKRKNMKQTILRGYLILQQTWHCLTGALFFLSEGEPQRI